MMSFNDRAAFFRLDRGGRDRFGNQEGSGRVPLGRVWGNMRVSPGKEAIRSGRPMAETVGTLRVPYDAAPRSVGVGCFVDVLGGTWRIVGGPERVGDRVGVVEFRCEKSEAVTDGN